MERKRHQHFPFQAIVTSPKNLWNYEISTRAGETDTGAKIKELLSVKCLNTWYAMSNPQKQFDETLTKDKWDYYPQVREGNLREQPVNTL